MTRIELSLIMKIIDCHAKTYNSTYYGGDGSKYIDNVPALKAEIIKYYEEILREED